MKDLKQKTLSGFIYKFAERGAAQGISFIVQIILARLLMPEEFGTVALLTVLMLILDVFVTYGFGNSLVVNKKSDDLDFSTCFYFGITLALALYAVVYVCSPYISQFCRLQLSILCNTPTLQKPCVSGCFSMLHLLERYCRDLSVLLWHTQALAFGHWWLSISAMLSSIQ